MTDTTWTPEARKIREAERAAATKALQLIYTGASPYDTRNVGSRVDGLFPPPPPEYTYGRLVTMPPIARPTWEYARRRSDGYWERLCTHSKKWEPSHLDDRYARAVAAEVPFTDAECEYILHEYTYAELRRNLASVLRGELK